MRSRQVPSVIRRRNYSGGPWQLPVLRQLKSVYVCLVAHVCLHRRAGLVLARRSVWTHGKVALRVVVAHKEPVPRVCDIGVPL